MSTLDDFYAALAEFNERFRGRDVPELKPLGPFDVGPVFRREIDWDQAFAAHQRGVYCFLDPKGVVHWVGKAGPNRVLADRIREHDIWRKKHRMPAEGSLVAVPVPDDQSFIAAALEEFLIWHLDPYSNTRGRRPE